jgi:hypothetical protein
LAFFSLMTCIVRRGGSNYLQRGAKFFRCGMKGLE